MKSQLTISYEEIISEDNLFLAWQEFLIGKRGKNDVQKFGLKLADNILQLHDDLANLRYGHGGYDAFNISDPKPRNIHKAAVRDRVLHHAIYGKLYPFFDRLFISDSYSCRLEKGTHKALDRFGEFGRIVSQNHTRTAWVLKCDIRKFFASIDHSVLLGILTFYVPDGRVLWLLKEVIESFHFEKKGKGLPLGNLTSQLFCNIYMNEFDQFVKHRLRVKHYIRYADDFVLFSDDKNGLVELIPQIAGFLSGRLLLSLHSDKVMVKSVGAGVDFLGWVHFPHHRVPRTITRKRMFARLRSHPTSETLQSYLGLLKHGNSYGLQEDIKNLYGLLNDSFRKD